MNKINRKPIIGFFIAFSIFINITGEAIAAANDATQEATTAQATTINIVGKAADTTITTITFPESAPSSTISTPYNNVDTSGDPQVLASSDSEPVVRLKNTHSGTLQVWLEITTWSNGIVSSEDYELVDTTTTNIDEVNDVLSSDGNANSVDTAITMGTGTYKALYLELVLSSVAGQTGNSTITVLGETP